MSFSVFASGAGSFHYNQDNNVEGSDFELLSLLSVMATTKPNVKEIIATAADRTLPSVGVGTAGDILANREFLYMLSSAVSLLAISPGADGARISVASRQSHLLWPTTVGFASYNFSPGDDPGAEFVRIIGPSLKRTDLNNWGVLRAMAIVLSKYYDHLQGTNMTPLISIQLSK